MLQHSSRFVVNVLTQEQIDISRLFVSRDASRFGQVGHTENAHGLPCLHAAAAWFECQQLSWPVAGDHCLLIAEVKDHAHSDATAPLLLHAGA